MDELTFRSKDRFRWSWHFAALVGVAAAAAGARAVHDFGAAGLAWAIGGTAALALPALLLRGRWSTVGPSGITFHRPLARHGRTYPWHEIQWLEVYATDRRFGEFRTLQVHFADGRSRFLNGLVQDRTHPSPGFDTDVRRVRNWWELNTDASARVEPVRQFRDRITVTVAAVLATLVIAAVAAVIVFR
ncbi:hypothetical protein [Kitasatospora purpeofusca]|uniref:PH domain-containing protein n=1 Tax=Kitasatospora purpeofusca TaxID=67352 RepID=A0ABZ1U2H6_9ACTN|nr:hypothetical protein [Kitasatospora purpeofusca]